MNIDPSPSTSNKDEVDPSPSISNKDKVDPSPSTSNKEDTVDWEVCKRYLSNRETKGVIFRNGLFQTRSFVD